ncbi:hypothetical protein [Photobacterium damselae]|uniref:hypothetical protein n=1 Tax=Photobacterium damselae TaxID=38293 RepID=UPI001F31498E|nr:hypothetical protein [Photobacterium damselae]UKA04860.1 hypothetical protein IHC89_21695 [Photobacterium damselae subsp. damselae]
MNNKTSYRANKIQIFGQFLTEDEAVIVREAIQKASQKTGVTNNRKNRMALLEITRHYLETINEKD